MNFVVPEISVKHNMKLSVYPDGSFKVVCCNKPIFLEKHYVLVNNHSNVKQHYNMENQSRVDSVKRAKEKVFDITKLNQFDYFVTLTLDSQKVVSRYDSEEVKKILLNWLKNMSYRHSLVYLLIPEFHKDNAIHMHMLCNGDLNLVDSNKRDKSNRIIYNLVNWNYGFSSVVKISGDYEFVARYITKYVTKDSYKIFGKFYYSGGQNLKRDVPILLKDCNFDSLKDLKIYSVSGTDLKFCYPTFDDLRRLEIC